MRLTEEELFKIEYRKGRQEALADVEKMINKLDAELNDKILETYVDGVINNLNNGELVSLIMEKGRLLLKEVNKKLKELETK